MRRAPFVLTVGEAVLTAGHATGAVRGAGHLAAWNLRFEPTGPVHRHLPWVAYLLPVADTVVLSPYLGARFRGSIKADGVRYELEDDAGCQSHLWGRRHAAEWAWAHCSAFEGEPGACLEALMARVRRWGRSMPPLTLVSLCHRGEWLRLQGLVHLPWGRSAWQVGQWRFQARGATARVEGEVLCPPGRLLRAEYADPDGSPAWCHNSEVATSRVRVWRRAAPGLPWREAGELVSNGTTHAEWGERSPSPEVAHRLAVEEVEAPEVPPEPPATPAPEAMD
ncbi:MAG: hypothetical protein HY722_06015 [Planctomycetes bacterium]|nr:hypothetical protein [Planctomycetota bacterium]